MADPKKIDLTVIVNGQPTQVTVFESDPLITVVVSALQATGNSGQPPENWELRDSVGDQLSDLQKTVGEYGLTDKSELSLNLKAGVGGHE